MSLDISLDGTLHAQDFLRTDSLANSSRLNVDAAVTVDIAPWDEPPTPPPKSATKSSFSSQQSSSSRYFGSFGSKRPSHSSTNLTSVSSSSRRALGSDATITSNGTESPIYADPGSYGDPFSLSGSTHELRKPKSSLNLFKKLRTQKSRARLKSGESDRDRAGSGEGRNGVWSSGAEDGWSSSAPNPAGYIPNGTPASEGPNEFRQLAPIHAMGPASPNALALGMKVRKRKASNLPPPLPPKEGESLHGLGLGETLNLDTNIENMEGIVDMRRHDPNSPPTSPGGDSSSWSHYQLPNPHPHYNSSSSGSFNPKTPPQHQFFSDPFHPTALCSSKTAKPPPIGPPGGLLDSKVSPKTVTGDASWAAPDSWGIIGEEDDDANQDVYSSSDDDAVGRPTTSTALSSTHPNDQSSRDGKRKSRRRTVKLAATSVTAKSIPFNIRIYRSNNSYHVASIKLSVTVGELTPVLNTKLLGEKERETHRLYLKERGRERMLAQTERPADIVRRRLEQAGYTAADNMNQLACEDMTFLFKFIYKSQLLGPAEQDLKIESFEYIDLQNKSLRTIPVSMYARAEKIISLSLSRNPMIDIPLDFIQSCTQLTELRLANMAMKRVPNSLHFATALHRLDFSSNRMGDLDDAQLDVLTHLTTLKLQNNRIEKLPTYFARLMALTELNISNNKFSVLPPAVCEIGSLKDLDVSFNMLAELPEAIGKLGNLQRLILCCNRLTRFPDGCLGLKSLQTVDCRRNKIADLSVVSGLPKLRSIYADHNNVSALELRLGPQVLTLDTSCNDITKLRLSAIPGYSSFSLTDLDISNAKLSSLDDSAVALMTSLQNLNMDNNSFRFLPDSLGDLSKLQRLSCSGNQLDSLPSTIGKLQKLEALHVHSNSLTELPESIWGCEKLHTINVTSNLIEAWPDPPIPQHTTDGSNSPSSWATPADRKGSTPGSIASMARYLPPLAQSLERLHVGENLLTDDGIHALRVFRELKVLNLSFNQIQELPGTFFKNMTQLRELYLSGNKLANIPTEDLHRMPRLSAIFLNGNKMHTLPRELGKVTNLAILDVGNNLLKYNINNWEYDWNWNFNPGLQYLNLSGNKRLEIRPDRSSAARQNQVHDAGGRPVHPVLADFSGLKSLRVLGLMDVTTTFMESIPDESESRRVRTSLSEVNNMAYGIADNLGKTGHLNMFDLVQPEFRKMKDEAIFAMFGRAQPQSSDPRLPKFLRDSFVRTFQDNLSALGKGETVQDALRRSFLRLNKLLHDYLYEMSTSSRKMSQSSTTSSSVGATDLTPMKTGASGVVLYFQGKTLYAANAGNALAVVSRAGTAMSVSEKHEPWNEIGRIRTTEGWITPRGLVNEQIDISRSFGFFQLVPVLNACPFIKEWPITEEDEFVIVSNRGLWDYVSYQVAVDIARSERADPMIAAQKLRDFAISYGAEGSVMIMVISLSDTKAGQPGRPLDGALDPDPFLAVKSAPRKGNIIGDRSILRLPGEVSAPTGQVALAFTDIRNSTHLWEVNPGMPTAMRLHNNLLRRQLRFCGGYEVKTEGDAFMCSFPTALSAVWWCLSVQELLLQEPWPLEILECEDGKDIYVNDKLVARGLSVRMGIHFGFPVCEKDPVTHRMDYFGPMVNRSARIEGSAAGGQVMCSAEVVREITAKVLTDEHPDGAPANPAVDALRRMSITLITVGEVKLKGMEAPEVITLLYSGDLVGRQEISEESQEATASGSRVQFSIAQIRDLAMLCLRLEALATSRVFKPLLERKPSIKSTASDPRVEDSSVITYCDPNLLLPPMSEKASDNELMTLLDSLSGRIENALSSLTLNRLPPGSLNLVEALKKRGEMNQQTLQSLLAILQGV